MTNCLSDSSFENLLFVHVRIQEAESIALFDTGAGMTVISRSLLARLGITAENAALRAGSNNGLLRTLQTAVLSPVRIGDICVETLRVLVTGDADFALSDSSGAAFPAEMLLGWDVIARYRCAIPRKTARCRSARRKGTARLLIPTASRFDHKADRERRNMEQTAFEIVRIQAQDAAALLRI